VIFKARERNVVIGDFSTSYAPLFLIAPSGVEHASRPDHRRPRGPCWPSTHPSFENRIRRLAEMAHLAPEAISDRIREYREARRKARMIAVEAAADPHLSPPPPAAEAEPRIGV
jgi:hypothetical protein